MKHNILLIDDSDEIRVSLKRFLEDEGFFVKVVASGDEGVALVRQGIIPFSLALVDFHMPGLSGDSVIKELKKYDDDLCILTFSGDDSLNVHTKTLDSGASFVVSKVTEDAKLLGVLHRICRDVEKRSKPLTIASSLENSRLISSVDMVGASNSLAEVARIILKCAPHQQSVLILGENGTGKEKIAQAIHKNSNRKSMPFVPVNCGGISKDLIASELFGHEKGAFTGAINYKIGKFQAAQGGTIFLDEIGEMPLDQQIALLRVLQEKAIVPVGSNEQKKIDVRVIAATNASLDQLIEAGRFRQDLFYRLNGFPIVLPPLRQRPEDIPLLVRYFLELANKEMGTKKIILQSTVDEMMKYSWPGNIRELQNLVSRLVMLCDDEQISPTYLKQILLTEIKKEKPEKSEVVDFDTLHFQLKNAEKNKIIEMLNESGQNVSKAARASGMSRSTFRDKIKSYGIILTKSTLMGVEK